jgi:hypothetical protein
MRTVLSLSLVVVLLGYAAPAQEPVKPGPEHKKLEAMVGVWDAMVHSKEGDSKGTMTYKMGLGGLWLFENFEGEFGGMKFQGKGMTTYDPAKKKYINVWIDSMSTSPMISEGNYDGTNRMVMKGEMPMGPGQTVPVTMVSEMKDENNMVFTMTTPGADGKEMMKITYKRRSK